MTSLEQRLEELETALINLHKAESVLMRHMSIDFKTIPMVKDDATDLVMLTKARIFDLQRKRGGV